MIINNDILWFTKIGDTWYGTGSRLGFYRSDDMKNWEEVYIDYPSRCVAGTPEKYIVSTRNNGIVLFDYSDEDNAGEYYYLSGTTNTIYDDTTGTFIVVDSNGMRYESTDGHEWSAAPGYMNNQAPILFDGTTFYRYTYGGNLDTSTDFVEWEHQGQAEFVTSSLSSVSKYVNNTLIVTQYNQIVSTTDGLTADTVSTPLSFTGSVSGIYYLNGQWLVTSWNNTNTYLYSSTDLITWTLINTLSGRNVRNMFYISSSGRYVVNWFQPPNDVIYTTTNLTTAANTWTLTNPFYITDTGPKYILQGDDETLVACSLNLATTSRTTNGTTWSQSTNSYGGTMAATYASGNFIQMAYTWNSGIGRYTATTRYSSDGSSWTNHDYPDTLAQFTPTGYEKFFASGNSLYFARNFRSVVSDDNGETFSPALTATTFDGIDILRANYEQFIPIFHNGIIYTPYEYSTDLGQTKHTIPEASSSNMFSPVIIDDMAVLTFTEYDNVLGKFVPKIITTEDAVTWNTIDPIIDDENMNFQQIHFCDGRYTTNNLFRSDDLLNWEAFSIKQTPPSSKWNYFDWNDLTNVDFITSGTFSTDTNLFLFGTNPNDSTLWCRISEDAETYVGVPQTTPRNPLFTNSTHLFVIEDEFVKKTVDASTYDTVIESIDNEVYIFADEDYLFSKDDTTAYAIDLNTLTRITTDLNVDVKAIVNFSGAYIGISDTSVFYSEDGISWDENPIPGVNRDYTNSYIFVAGSVVFIVAAGDGYNQMWGTYALSSTDGVTWDEVFWEVYSYNNASMKELLSAPVYNPNNDSIVMEFTGEDYDLEKTVGMKFISFAPFEEFIHIYEGYDMNYKYMPLTSYFSGLTYFNEKFVFGLTPTVPSNNLSPIYSTTDFNDITITDMVESPVDMTVDRIVGSPYNNMVDVVTKEGDDTLNKAVLVVKRGMSGG